MYSSPPFLFFQTSQYSTTFRFLSQKSRQSLHRKFRIKGVDRPRISGSPILDYFSNHYSINYWVRDTADTIGPCNKNQGTTEKSLAPNGQNVNTHIRFLHVLAKPVYRGTDTFKIKGGSGRSYVVIGKQIFQLHLSL